MALRPHKGTGPPGEKPIVAVVRGRQERLEGYINLYISIYIYFLSIGMGSQYSRYTGTCHILLAQVPNQVKRSFSARASC